MRKSGGDQSRSTGINRKSEANYRNLLLARQADLVVGLDEAKFDTLASMGRVAEDDQAPLSHEEFISLQINSIDYQELKLVQSALQRLDDGRFGTCQSCEKPISQKRLQALPWAQFCVSCQETLHRMTLEPEAAHASADAS